MKKMDELAVKIAVAAHKPYPMPGGTLYVPVRAGATLDPARSGFDGFAQDDSGENISWLNPYFCELTVLYWAWKNLDACYIGLVQYRRYLGTYRRGSSYERILTPEDLTPHLGKVKIFLPRKRRYFIETLSGHYAHTQDGTHLALVEKILLGKHSEYEKSWKRATGKRSGYMFNIMIMERSLLDEYCRWLFGILFEMYGCMNLSGLSDYEKRLFGRVSEILFNVWLDRQLDTGAVRENEILEIPCICTEKTNWIKKISAFLRAKFLGVKYDGTNCG